MSDFDDRLYFRVHRFGSVGRFELDPMKSLIKIVLPPTALNGDRSLDNDDRVTVLLSEAGLLKGQHV